jgi:hypothetical protein
VYSVQIYGHKADVISWHDLPHDKYERVIFLAQVKRLPQNEVSIPPEWRSFITQIKVTHRSMIQVTFNKRRKISLLVSKYKSENCCEIYFYSALFLEEFESVDYNYKDKTLVCGARWKSNHIDILITARLNGKRILHKNHHLSDHNTILLSDAQNTKPGDVIEVTLQNADGLLDRIAVNLGSRKTA